MPRCPACFVPMSDVVKGGVHVKTCSHCFGEWMSRTSLMHLVRSPAELEDTASGAAAAGLKELAALVHESDTTQPLTCTECHIPLTIDRPHPLIPVNLQFCRKCSGAWLDVGKLPLVRKLYQALLQTTDSRLTALRARLARVELGVGREKERLESLPTMRQIIRHGTGAAAALDQLISVLLGEK